MFRTRLALAVGVSVFVVALAGCQVKIGPGKGADGKDGVSEHLDPVTKEDTAERDLKRLNGKVKRDKNLPDNPVVEVRLFNKDATDDDLKELSKYTELRKLEIGGTQITGTGVSHLVGLTKLEELHMGFSPANDAGMKEVAKLKQLKVLDVLQTKITEDGVKEFAALENLEDLRVGQNFNVNDVGFYHLKPYVSRPGSLWAPNVKVDAFYQRKGLWKLRKLDVSNSGVGDGAMKAVAELPEIRTLRLNGSAVTDLGYGYVGKMQNLEEIQTSYGITDKGVAELGNLKQLRKLSVWNSWVSIKAIRALPNLKNLKELDISTYGIKPEEAAKLRDELPNCNVLHKK